ncbi:hypothetical protein KIN20_011026 [Parelaphostrongylus tenuis]|uniref:Non-specific serine/threonine protein kinase n=1 Tax=Parelaphostrongylus tenuis TaxID=148309 RepID=A0AAD5MUB5_PARTN|nr:hypothetical protein KIN20_011026 [Parelaphostrongylus tenuis]
MNLKSSVTTLLENSLNYVFMRYSFEGDPRMILLDFGASRSYGKNFVDGCTKLVKAASERDARKILEMSREIGLLSGYESSIMEKAHVESVLIMGRR